MKLFLISLSIIFLSLSLFIVSKGITTMYVYSSNAHIVGADAYNFIIIANRGIGLIVAGVAIAIISLIFAIFSTSYEKEPFYYFNAIKNSFDFTGLTSRKEYFGFYLFNGFFSIFFILINIIYVKVYDCYNDVPYGLIVYEILTFIPSLSIYIRRLRDAEVNIPLFIALPIISAISFLIRRPLSMFFGVILLLLLFYIVFFKKGSSFYTFDEIDNRKEDNNEV